MVKSIITPEVNYKEARKLETTDIKYHAPMYHIDMYGITVRISIGQINKQFEQRGILYVPIYLIYKKKVTDRTTKLTAIAKDDTIEGTLVLIMELKLF